MLVRWWTAPGCVFCEASAPALNDFWRRYASADWLSLDFTIISHRSLYSLANVKRQSRNSALNFPVAVDPDWNTLRRWWLEKHDHGWTSVTFLLDRQGVIRHVHPGGAFFEGEAGYDLLEKKIQELLDESFTTYIQSERAESV